MNEPEKLDLRSYDVAEDRTQELLRLFPEIRTEDGKIDFERLKLALGVIFITIDDGEARNLRAVCDEVFGEENFVANVVWQKKYAVSNDDPGIASMHDHVLVYQCSENFERNLLPRTEKQTSRYTNPDNDPRGDWSSDNYVSNKSRQERPTLWYPIRHLKTGEEVWPEESAVWRYSREKHKQIEREGRLYWGPDMSYTSGLD